LFSFLASLDIRLANSDKKLIVMEYTVFDIDEPAQLEMFHGQLKFHCKLHIPVRNFFELEVEISS
jgi:hypothetical protein